LSCYFFDLQGFWDREKLEPKQVLSRSVMDKYRKWILYSIGGAILCIGPFFLSQYVISVIIFIGIYAIVAMGLGLLIGYAGQVSLGHNAFYGLGAYTSGILSFRYGVSPWVGILCGIVLTGGIAYLIGKPIFRFRGHMLVIVTCAMGLIFWGLFGEMDFITGGYEGFSRIPHLSIGGFIFNQDIHYYYLVLAIFAFLFFVMSNITKSKTGIEFRTIDIDRGGSEVAAETIGINIGKIKTRVFILSAVYASIGGSLYAHYVTHLDPGPFSLWNAFVFVIMVVIGGARSILGPVVGPAFYIGLKELISQAVPTAHSPALAGYEIVIFSLVFVMVLLFFPQGLVQIPTVLSQRRIKK
jgi:branched-chain amino acid transport system permease protein